MNKLQGNYYYKEVFENVFLIGCQFHQKTPMQESWFEMGDKYEFGAPTGNSWLIKGKEKAILIDSAAPVQGLREFVEKLVDVPIMLIISHGHYDHIFRLEEFDEFWIHAEDIPLLNGILGFPKYSQIPQNIHCLQEGDIIDLGDRMINVFQIKGHSNGSLLLLDSKSKVLFTGDSIARRILLFDIDRQKIQDYFYKIKQMQNEDYHYICSCHDRVPLHKEYINYLFENLIHLKNVHKTRQLFDGRFGDFYSLKMGDESKEHFVNCSVIAEYKDFLVQVIEKLNY